MSMLSMASLFFLPWYLWESVVVANPPDSPLILFALWVSEVVTFLGLWYDAYGGGPITEVDGVNSKYSGLVRGGREVFV